MPSKQRPGAEEEALNQLGARLAEKLEIDVMQVRYATYRYHNGHGWTLRAHWEQQVAGSWVEVGHDDVPDSYRGP